MDSQPSTSVSHATVEAQIETSSLAALAKNQPSHPHPPAPRLCKPRPTAQCMPRYSCMQPWTHNPEHLSAMPPLKPQSTLTTPLKFIHLVSSRTRSTYTTHTTRISCATLACLAHTVGSTRHQLLNTYVQSHAESISCNSTPKLR